MSWNKADGVTLDDDEVIFSLTFTAKTNAKTSEVLTLNSSYTKGEAYSISEEMMDVKLMFTRNGNYDEQKMVLYQNRPNPFDEKTIIGFYLPKANRATITIMDIAGRELKRVSGEFDWGYNELVIKQSALNGNGVLIYRLETAKETLTRKMILFKR